MSNVHADKARTLIRLAEKNRTQFLADVAGKQNPSSQDRFEFALRQDDLQMLVSVAQVHATLATVHENEVFEAPEEPEEKEDPTEPGLGEQDPTVAFLQGLDETLGLLRGLTPLIRLVAVPRTVKDTPQA